MRYVHDSQPCNQHCRCRCQARSNKRVASRSFGRRLARRHCSRSFDIRYCIRIRPAVCTFRWRNCSNTVNTCSSRIHPSCIHSRIRNNYSACIGCWCKVGCKRARKHRPSMRIRRSNDVGRGRRCNTASKEKFNRINFRLEITELPPSYNSNDISSRRKFPIYWLCTSPCTERIPSSCNCGKKRFDSYFSIDQFIYIYMATYLIFWVQIPWLSSGKINAVDSRRTARKSRTWGNAVSRCMSNRFAVFTGAVPSRLIVSCDEDRGKTGCPAISLP